MLLSIFIYICLVVISLKLTSHFSKKIVKDLKKGKAQWDKDKAEIKKNWEEAKSNWKNAKKNG